MEFIGALFGVGFGFVLASGVDRFAAGHALTTTGGVLMDAPAAGQIYDSEAPALPIWGNWQRLAYAGGAVAVPMVLAGMTGGKVRDALKLIALGALVRTAGKAIEDAIATFATSQPIVQQLYAPEIAATTRLNQANTAALASAPAATFAGFPQQRRAKQLGMGDNGDGCMPAMNAGIITDPVADRNSFATGNGQMSAWPSSCGNCGQCSQCCFNPLAPTPTDTSFPQPLTIPPAPPPVIMTAPPPPPTPPMVFTPPAAPPTPFVNPNWVPANQGQPPPTPPAIPQTITTFIPR